MAGRIALCSNEIDRIEGTLHEKDFPDDFEPYAHV